MEIIGITGKARAGKDTVADILEELSGGTVDREAFADRIKQIAAISLGICNGSEELGLSGIRRWADQFKSAETVVVLDPRNTVISKVTGREFLQRLGADAIRSILGESVLIDAISLDRDADLLLLTDVRTIAEAVMIREAGGEVWRVHRPGAGSNGHRIERGIPDSLIDVEIDNSGSIADLWQAVRDELDI